jgi:hypothetical protein
MMNDLPIEISRHARQQMQERGVEQAEVIAAIRQGQPEPTRKKEPCIGRIFSLMVFGAADDTGSNRWHRLLPKSQIGWSSLQCMLFTSEGGDDENQL